MQQYIYTKLSLFDQNIPLYSFCLLHALINVHPNMFIVWPVSSLFSKVFYNFCVLLFDWERNVVQLLFTQSISMRCGFLDLVELFVFSLSQLFFIFLFIVYVIESYIRLVSNFRLSVATSLLPPSPPPQQLLLLLLVLRLPCPQTR